FTGKAAEELLDSVGITVNKNTIPFETESPFITSGIRMGTAALTTRGMGEQEMRVIGELIAKTLEPGRTDFSEIRQAIAELTGRFPLYPELN
ncbi:MAG TPA: serine hydroxymethyltransferase, partial [Limnochordia bacterium]|nr:serine hydroxymethyltransferase [Limnochordia bacterium]